MTTQECIKVHIDYRDCLVAAGLAATLGGQADFQLVGGGSATAPPPDHAAPGAPAVIVADYESALACLARQKNAPSRTGGRCAGILILSDRHSESEIRYALAQGARGYLALDCALDELFDAVRAVRHGLRYLDAGAQQHIIDSCDRKILTERETDVLRLLVEGDGNKGIARKLNIAPDTVKSHAKSIFQKLGAASRTEVATLAERRGLLKLPAAAAPSGQGHDHGHGLGHGLVALSL
ncbi:response regulator transcription factor [Rugamonas sp.]|uniref:response regulator transcription factor n=1 Tax=Rugamonas sp. TaxID=1926287 RepID=UPI0025CC5579|nr:response regulator transcription factor [Rugamonas sp.]